MPAPKVASIDFAPPADISSGDCELSVAFEDGGGSTFKVATYDRAEAWMTGAIISGPVAVARSADVWKKSCSPAIPMKCG